MNGSIYYDFDEHWTPERESSAIQLSFLCRNRDCRCRNWTLPYQQQSLSPKLFFFRIHKTDYAATVPRCGWVSPVAQNIADYVQEIFACELIELREVEAKIEKIFFETRESLVELLNGCLKKAVYFGPRNGAGFCKIFFLLSDLNLPPPTPCVWCKKTGSLLRPWYLHHNISQISDAYCSSECYFMALKEKRRLERAQWEARTKEDEEFYKWLKISKHRLSKVKRLLNPPALPRA